MVVDFGAKLSGYGVPGNSFKVSLIFGGVKC
jgi:hypothetical protein